MVEHDPGIILLSDLVFTFIKNFGNDVMVQTQKGLNRFSAQYIVVTLKTLKQYIVVFQGVFSGNDLFGGQSCYILLKLYNEN